MPDIWKMKHAYGLWWDSVSASIQVFGGNVSASKQSEEESKETKKPAKGEEKDNHKEQVGSIAPFVKHVKKTIETLRLPLVRNPRTS